MQSQLNGCFAGGAPDLVPKYDFDEKPQKVILQRESIVHPPDCRNGSGERDHVILEGELLL